MLAIPLVALLFPVTACSNKAPEETPSPIATMTTSDSRTSPLEADVVLDAVATQLTAVGVVDTWTTDYPSRTDLENGMCHYDTQEYVAQTLVPVDSTHAEEVLIDINFVLADFASVAVLDKDDDPMEWDIEASSPRFGTLSIDYDHGTLELEVDDAPLDASKCAEGTSN